MDTYHHYYVHVCLVTDIRTQADYQMMDPNFVGLIFSCFHEVEKVMCVCDSLKNEEQKDICVGMLFILIEVQHKTHLLPVI